MTSPSEERAAAAPGGAVRIRPARLEDARGIYHLIAENPGELVPRPIASVVQNIDRFVVVEDEGGLVGAASFGIYPEIGEPRSAAVELQSVCIRADRRGLGLGRRLVEAVIARIRPFAPCQVVVLTFTPPFFAKLGFREVEKRSLMYKLYMGCVNCTKHESPFTCPEVAMALPLVP